MLPQSFFLSFIAHNVFLELKSLFQTNKTNERKLHYLNINFKPVYIQTNSLTIELRMFLILTLPFYT